MYGIVDCNNFFVSCERVFDPKLWDKPVVVLSNNDGCAVAISNEAKALGIRRGDPLFKIQDIVDAHGVITLSGNHKLYGDMSSRVMMTLASIFPEIEIYSIDECFINLEGFPEEKLEEINIFAQKPQIDTFSMSGKLELPEEDFDFSTWITDIVSKIKNILKI